MMNSVPSYQDHPASALGGEAKGVSVKVTLDSKSVQDGLRVCQVLARRPELISEFDGEVLVEQLPDGGFGLGKLFAKLFRFQSDVCSTGRAGEVIVSLQPTECLRDIFAACGAANINRFIVEYGRHLDTPSDSDQVVAETGGGSRSLHRNTGALCGQGGNDV